MDRFSRLLIRLEKSIIMLDVLLQARLSSLVESWTRVTRKVYSVLSLGPDYLLASSYDCFFQGLANDGKNSWIIHFRDDVARI